MSDALPKVILDGEQAKLWAETKAAALWSQPLFSDILYGLMTEDDGDQAYFTDSKEIPIAAVDDRTMYINPEPFFKLPLAQRIFVVCHEVMHAAFSHIPLGHALSKLGKVTYNDGATLPYDHEQMNIAMDLVINDILITSEVGKFVEGGMHDPKVVDGSMNALDAYRKIYVKGDPTSGGNGQGKGGQGKAKGFDKHLKPGQGKGKAPDEAMAERNEAEWRNGVASAIESARLAGKLPAGLERVFGKLVEPEVTWEDKLSASLSRQIGHSGSSWEHLDAELLVRGIGAPGRVAYGAELVVVAIDTSGSMSQTMMDQMLGETAGIIDVVKPRRLVVIQCDAAVQEVVECDNSDDLKRMKIKGLGGTDFRPVFEWVEREGEHPDALVYFTDLFGAFPDRAPDYPTIWASLTKGMQVPFGDYIDVPIRYDDKHS